MAISFFDNQKTENIVTAFGEVVTDPIFGGVVTTELGVNGTEFFNTPSRVSGLRDSGSQNISFTEFSPYIYIVDTSSNKTINLYNGGSVIRQHLLLNQGAGIITVEYEGNTLDTLSSSDQISVVWDTLTWIII